MLARYFLAARCAIRGHRETRFILMEHLGFDQGFLDVVLDFSQVLGAALDQTRQRALADQAGAPQQKRVVRDPAIVEENARVDVQQRPQADQARVIR